MDSNLESGILSSWLFFQPLWIFIVFAVPWRAATQDLPLARPPALLTGRNLNLAADSYQNCFLFLPGTSSNASPPRLSQTPLHPRYLRLFNKRAGLLVVVPAPSLCPM